jgi:hypothetical protein
MLITPWQRAVKLKKIVNKMKIVKVENFDEGDVAR